MKITRLVPLLGVVAGATVVACQLLRRSRFLPLDHKVVFITGGSRGVGLLLAREFATKGARVAVCARREAELQRAKDQLAQEGLSISTFVCDVRVQEQVETLIRDVEAQLGPIDVLVNNAGVMELGPVETLTLADHENELQTHYFAHLYTIDAVLPSMKSRGGGRIVNITSIGGKFPLPHMAAYCGAKSAATGFSQTLHAELLKDNVLVTTVCPLIVRVGSFYNADMKGQHRKEFALGALFNAFPLTSMSGPRLARQIVGAAQHGDAVLIPSRREKLVLSFFGLFPGLTCEVLGVVNRFLPGPEGPESIGKESRKGKESTTPLTPSLLTLLNDRAALDTNQLGDPDSALDGELTRKIKAVG